VRHTDEQLEYMLRVARDAEGAAATNPDCPWMPAPDSGCPVCGNLGNPHEAIERYLETFTPEAVRGLLDELMYLLHRESS